MLNNMDAWESFKVKQLMGLRKLEEELVVKYPESANRIRELVYHLTIQLDHLSEYNLFDYLFTLHLASGEFSEFSRLMPSEEEVSKLLS